MKILLLGYIIRGPLGGMVWHHMQYFIGLHQLGHEVYFLEDSGDSEYSCYNPVTNTVNSNPEFGLGYANKLFESFQLHTQWAYYDKNKDNWHGPLSDTIFEKINGADMLINLSVSNTLRPWFFNVKKRVL